MNKSTYSQKFLSFLALASLAALFQTGHAAPETKKKPKPTADQVVAKHLKAIGGLEAQKKFKTRRLEMTMAMPGLFENGRVTTTQKAPDKIHKRVIIPGFGETVEVCDGKRAWKKEPEQNARLLAGHELVQALREARFNSGIEMLTEGDIIYVQRTKIDGNTFHVLKGSYGKDSPWSGLEMQFYFDQRTYLMGRMKMPINVNGASVEITIVLDDYKKVDGIPHPSQMTMLFDDKPTVEMTFDKITHNIEVVDALFAMPGKE
mgnify:CR=1 FL=1